MSSVPLDACASVSTVWRCCNAVGTVGTVGMAPCAHDAAVPGVPVDSCESVGQVPVRRYCSMHAVGSNTYTGVDVSAVSGDTSGVLLL